MIIRILKTLLFIPYLAGWLISFCVTMLIGVPIMYVIKGWDMEDTMDWYYENYTQRWDEWR